MSGNINKDLIQLVLSHDALLYYIYQNEYVVIDMYKRHPSNLGFRAWVQTYFPQFHRLWTEVDNQIGG